MYVLILGFWAFLGFGSCDQEMNKYGRIARWCDPREDFIACFNCFD